MENENGGGKKRENEVGGIISLLVAHTVALAFG
jgi:hypothetical protein